MNTRRRATACVIHRIERGEMAEGEAGGARLVVSDVDVVDAPATMVSEPVQ